ncbi:MAG: hypothetical protein L0Z53_15280 [Acidobacteriales bacterium]|nr:hypothetical protein [Terriglobales bacterium]
MKLSTLFMMLLVSCFAAAQQYPRYELSAGYSYGSPDDLTPTNNTFSPRGWNGSFATNLKRWVALEVDAGGQYLNKSVLISGVPYSLNSGFFAFHAGPRFAYRGEKMTPFVHTLFGVHRTLSYAQATFPAPGQVLVPYENAFGSAAGGGIDVALTRRLSLRTQGDYFLTRLSNGSLTALNGYENRFRVVGGIVFNFGGTDRWRARRPRRPHVDAVINQPQPAAVADIAPVQITPSPQPAASYAPSPMPLAPAPNSVRTTSVAVPSTAKPAAAAQASTNAAVAPKPAQTPATPIQTSGRVVPATQGYNSQIANRPAPVQQEESLGEVARRYRAKKKQQQTH